MNSIQNNNFTESCKYNQKYWKKIEMKLLTGTDDLNYLGWDDLVFVQLLTGASPLFHKAWEGFLNVMCAPSEFWLLLKCENVSASFCLNEQRKKKRQINALTIALPLSFVDISWTLLQMALSGCQAAALLQTKAINLINKT